VILVLSACNLKARSFFYEACAIARL
jgi:hypothetical protein